MIYSDCHALENILEQGGGVSSRLLLRRGNLGIRSTISMRLAFWHASPMTSTCLIPLHYISIAHAVFPLDLPALHIQTLSGKKTI